MNYFFVTLFNLLMIAAFIIPGFILKKTKLVSGKAAKDFSSVLLYVGTPFLVFSTMLGTDIYSVGPLNILICVVLSVAVHFIGVALGYLTCYKDKDKARKSVYAFVSAFSNCGFLGIPFTYAVMPEDIRGEAMLYVAIYNVVFNFLTWIIGNILFVDKEKRNKLSIVKSVFNPCTFGFLLALPFLFARYNLLEVTYVGKFISYLVNICVPLSMFVLGFRVADINFGSLVKNQYIYKNAAIRLVIVPLITLGIALLLRFIPGIDAAFVNAMTIMAAMPTAATAIALAERFDANSLMASEAVVSSTFLSIITVPLILLLVSAVV